MQKFYNTSPDEQETIINIDYSEKKVNVYSSRKIQIERLTTKLGQPTKTFYTDKKISGASWQVAFEDKKNMNVIFSKTVIVGQF